MAHKDGEASVEDILRSIKQVISREDGPRRSADTFARDAARENGQPVPERPASFSPYSFQRPSPFGARSAEPAPATEPAEEESIADDGRTDVFDLRSLDSDVFDVDEPEEREAATHDSDEPIILPPPEQDDQVEWTGRDRSEEQANDSRRWSDDDSTDGSPYADDTAEHSENEEPLELVEPAEEPVVSARPESQPEPAPATAPAPAPGTTEGLIAGAAADALRDRFSALQQAATRPAPAPSAANPLEDMVRDMLRPMLKQWLDENMPGLVEKIVEREIARITGRL